MTRVMIVRGYHAGVEADIDRDPPHKEVVDLATLVSENNFMQANEEQKSRRFLWLLCIGFTAVVSVLIGLAINENFHMTPTQRATLERIIN